MRRLTRLYRQTYSYLGLVVSRSNHISLGTYLSLKHAAEMLSGGYIDGICVMGAYCRSSGRKTVTERMRHALIEMEVPESKIQCFSYPKSTVDASERFMESLRIENETGEEHPRSMKIEISIIAPESISNMILGAFEKFNGKYGIKLRGYPIDVDVYFFNARLWWQTFLLNC